MADQGGLKKRMLLSFTVLGVLMTAALFLIDQGLWLLAVAIYVFGAIGFSGANIFYDALIVDVSKPKDLHRVSSLGYALGYLGGGLLFAVNVLMTLYPEWFFLADKAEAVRWSFVLVAIWWIVFTLPLAGFVHEEREADSAHWLSAAKEGCYQLRNTFQHLRSLKQVWMFLLANAGSGLIIALLAPV